MTSSKEYQYGKLNESDLDSCPINQFQTWFDEYSKKGFPTSNSFTLSTSTKTGKVSSRIVLLKKVTSEGFLFFSNYKSTKGKCLEENPQASLLFYWPELERQVIVEGSVKKADANVSDEYFQSRPENSKAATICSDQSQPIESREKLEEQFNAVKSSGSLNRPEHWGGYLLEPSVVEFWQGRESRLNDRLRYLRDGSSWKITRLQP